MMDFINESSSGYLYLVTFSHGQALQAKSIVLIQLKPKLGLHQKQAYLNRTFQSILPLLLKCSSLQFPYSFYKSIYLLVPWRQIQHQFSTWTVCTARQRFAVFQTATSLRPKSLIWIWPIRRHYTAFYLFKTIVES